MKELMNLDGKLLVQNEESVENSYRNPMRVNSSASNIDFRGLVNKICQYVNIADILDKIKKGTEYVVEIPIEFQGGFDRGDYWMMENSKTGKMWPSLMELGDDGKNHIITPLPVKKQQFLQDNPAREITQTYHNLYMQQQMNELAGLIETTLEAVKQIEHGQMDDRIGLLNAGKQAVILALSQKDEESRKTAILLGTNNLNVAQNQILEAFKRKVNEFEALPKTKIGQFFRECVKTGYLDAKDEEYNTIQEYFNLYLEATRMLAGAYAICDDVDNAQRVFEMSIESVKGIDFSKLKTIEYVHEGKDIEKIYEDIEKYLISEKKICIEMTKEYDCLSIAISGDELLEVLSNDRERKISE